jgi:phospholipid/cholesterol/gamma-HCH transport system substrate-binding protein
METKHRVAGLHPALWTLFLVVLIVAAGVFTALAFNRDLQPYAHVTLVSDRSGLVMDPGAKVKLRGVEVGRVSSVEPDGRVRLQLELFPDQLKYIPANVEAQITAPTAFGAKYVELVTPAQPSAKNLAAGAVLRSRNVSTEVNTTFQNLVGVLNQIDPAKLNAVLSALGEGFRGKGEALGQATTDFNQVLLAINPRSETIRADYRALKGFSDTYAAAAPDIVTVLDAASTTSKTITDNAQALDSLLVNVTGLSDSGINLLGPAKDNLIHTFNVLEPTTRLLTKYNPELTCLLVGGYEILPQLEEATAGHNGKSLIGDAGILFGDDMYRYPDNLPINGAKGGPGGAPGCGSLPDVGKNFPARYVVTDTGWGQGMDVRPNPGIGFPGLANFGPQSRGTPKPPSIYHLNGGPAPGPVPYPGAPPYGAPWYLPDGTPLYPGLPPAIPGRPKEPGPPPPGSEATVVAHPAQVQPTPIPTVPPPPPPPASPDDASDH